MRRALVVVGVLLAGCGSSKPAAAPTETPKPTPVPKLVGDTLAVPLDRTKPDGESIDLKVKVEGPKDAPVFLFLSGGPGEPGVSFLPRTRKWLGPVADKVRRVAFDQRGTGTQALNCPRLQKQMGASDLSPPTQQAVTACASTIGDKRAHFTTADTVEDIEALRIALHADKLILDGISYGTYTAQRYALAYPKRVRALILDSVVPAEGSTPLVTTQMQAANRVLGKSTAAALHEIVARRHNGPQILDTLTSLSVGHPPSPGFLKAIRSGDDASLDRWLNGVAKNVHRFTAAQLSQGLHASTLCGDWPAPWGDASAPLETRKAKLDAAAAKLTDQDTYPFDRATATGNGFVLQCLYWPPMKVAKPAGPKPLPNVPTLMLSGAKDMSTPLEWAEHALTLAPGGRHIVDEDAGHDVQDQGDPKVLAAVRRLVASAG
jgi:pimeloyl-ACP methyl ester carboxylesterase